MTDPYKILNIPSTASDEEVKKAYRALARKYHPDNYYDNPLADLAQEKMKEINEAYDTIQKQRAAERSGGRGAYAGAGSSYSGYSGSGYGSAGSSAFYQVRAAIQNNNLNLAENLLDNISTRNGEWYFLRGSIYYRRGWIDQAISCFETACQLSPGNPEYASALERAQSSGQAYRPEGYEVFTSDCGNNLCGRIACACCLCNLCMGGGMIGFC